MAKRKTGNLVGSWAFLIGVVLALIIGLGGLTNDATWTWVLVVLGLIVGLVNIASDETSPFLLSAVALIIASAFGQGVLQAVSLLNDVVQALLILFVPATIVVAIKHVFGLARH
jgi:hypothetical protein